ncbi:hypothetical protein [Streptosporangium sp. NBC_01469]|uniref:hypothetical protein n=1 Tax=Streptosporangium sp. NBC_01469 TaxID=2903898 RepID=UPI002E283F20|nr:hypothetical protein [Streptosporangium sp. NBC_01469]
MVFVAEDVDQVSAVPAGLHDFVDLLRAGVVREELLHEACDLGADFSELTGHVALFFAEPAEFGVATVWRWCALGHVATVGGGSMVGERVGRGGCAGRWMAWVAVGRDRRPRHTPGRRVVEGRVHTRKILDVTVDDTQIAIHADGEPIRVVSRTATQEITRIKARAHTEQRKTSQECQASNETRHRDTTSLHLVLGWSRKPNMQGVIGVRDVRVILIGGTSNVGKSTVAQAVAEKLGFECLSTDGLARHPGRPWRASEWEVPAHVAEHYGSLTVDELITSVLGHYERLWPRVEELITTRAAEGGARTGLVLEGAALLPVRVATLEVSRTAAVWLTADDAVVRARVHAAGHYEAARDEEQYLMDKFLARTERYQTLMINVIDRLGLDRIDAGDGRSVAALVDSVLAAVDVQDAVRRSSAGW